MGQNYKYRTRIYKCDSCHIKKQVRKKEFTLSWRNREELTEQTFFQVDLKTQTQMKQGHPRQEEQNPQIMEGVMVRNPLC
jgi:hypothetical protein